MAESTGRRRRVARIGALPGLLIAVAMMALPQSADAFRTPFGDRVNASIERGLQYLRNQEAGGSVGGVTTPLAMLAFLEKRLSADWSAPPVGYRNSLPDDQARLQRMARYIVNNIRGINGNGPNSYETGSALMALSLYLSTGGPNNVGANRTVEQGIQNGVNALRGTQSNNAGWCNFGGWNYTSARSDGDLSTTQYAIAGLSAATAQFDIADDNLPRAVTFLNNSQNPDGGLIYRGCRNYRSASAMTAAGTWSYRLIGRPITDANVQRAMVWLRDNYSYDSHIISNWNQSYYYYLWGSSKSYEVTQDPGGVNGVFEDDIGGTRDPEADGFPEEPRGWYYDYAWYLTQTQNGGGNWPCGGNRGCWRNLAATPYAILVLERSLGGICGDDIPGIGDNDGVCQPEDNCPHDPNPDQSDRDGDGVGDFCDNCPDTPNPAQDDADGDEIGDVCDDYNCVPSGNEVCDGRDNDCDERFDEGNPGGNQGCNTGEPGVCAAGTTQCQGGQVICQRNVNPGGEVCDGQDNDCDGTIDDGNPGGNIPCDTGELGICRDGRTICRAGRIQCDRANDPSNEICDGLDNNCDGTTDEGNPQGDQACDTGGIGACSEGTTLCANGNLRCLPNAEAGIELCNGQDDDCDGNADEGNPGGGQDCPIGQGVGQCGVGQTACVNGEPACNPVNQAEPEVCDGRDNDCDGATDEEVPNVGDACQTGNNGACGEGVLRCRLGELACVGNQQGFPEVCDGEDNDCDGSIDEEVPGIGADCQTGQDGICADGQLDCIEGAPTCVSNEEPVDEVCDGQDNDCDGNLDEGDPEGGEFCDTGLDGVCGEGQTACRNGSVLCLQQVQPGDEVCDGQDNNCNGQTDEGDLGGGACETGGIGQCGIGIEACVAGAPTCVPSFEPGDEVCDGVDNDCDGTADEGNPGGDVACDTGEVGQCAIGLFQCVDGGLVCEGENDLAPESCNGQDDDCDGSVDEDVPQAGRPCETDEEGVCATGTYACQEGNLDCVPDEQPLAEVCDGLDNDCDGTSDEDDPGGGIPCQIEGRLGQCGFGLTTCDGGLIICAGENDAQPESCDGLDNDCDGSIDEGDDLPGVGDECDTGFFGECGPGTLLCEGGGLACVQNVEPVDEVCDGLDNDCDGALDEEVIGEDAPSCPTGLPGQCAIGIPTCNLGAFGCNQVEQPEQEVCDGEDNDCDGSIDEGLRNACGQCGAADPVEVCDGVDNDCDGALDEGGDLCPDNQLCVNGVCGEPCGAANECAMNGQECFEGACLDPCDAADCPSDWGCRDGVCIDPCDGVNCPAGQACAGGQCVPDNCFATGCPEGELCINGRCGSDPCAGAECPDGEFCDPRVEDDPATPENEQCIDSCADVACPLDQRCEDGQCVDDPCFGVDCGAGQICSDGACGPDQCAGLQCGDGQVCVAGQCIDDPCGGVECPDGQECIDVDGEAQCEWITDPNPMPEPEPESDGGVQDMGGDDDQFVPGGRDGGAGGAGGGGGGDLDGGTAGSEFGIIPSFDMGDADGGIGQDPEVVGCSCDAADGGELAWLWLLLIPAGAMRRRRRR